MLSLGGRFTTSRGAQPGRREFCAPYTYSAYPSQLNSIVEAMAGHDDNPESDPWVILGERVPVLERPTASAPVVGYLSHTLVIPSRAESPGSPRVRWREIFMPDGQTGWIPAEQIRNPADYHACFARIDGQWRMTAFNRP